MRGSFLLLGVPALVALGALCYVQNPGSSRPAGAAGSATRPDGPSPACSTTARGPGLEAERAREYARADSAPLPRSLSVPSSRPERSAAFHDSTPALSPGPRSEDAAPQRGAAPPEGTEFPITFTQGSVAARVLPSPGLRGPRSAVLPTPSEPALLAPLPVGIVDPAAGVPGDDLRAQRVQQLREEFLKAAGQPDEISADGRDYTQRYLDGLSVFDQQFIALYGYSAYSVQKSWVVQHDPQ